MGMPHPVSLPPGFRWEVVESGLELQAGGVSVLEVSRQRMGWVVRINVPGRAQYARTLAVGSEVAGVRFGNKWARSHKELLELSQPMLSQSMSGGRPAVGASIPDGADTPLQAVGSFPLGLELVETLEEIHALRGQLEAIIDRIEEALGDVIRQASPPAAHQGREHSPERLSRHREDDDDGVEEGRYEENVQA